MPNNHIKVFTLCKHIGYFC